MSEEPTDDLISDEAAPHRYQRCGAADIWVNDDTGHDLTIQESLFVRSYLIDMNKVAAMRRLNYTDPPAVLNRIADRYLAQPEVQGAIESLSLRLMKKLEITAERVAQTWAEIAFFDPREVMEFDGSNMRMLHSRYWRDHHVAAIQSIKVGEKGGVEVKFNDKAKALEMLGKHLAMIKDEGRDMTLEAARAAAQAAVEKVMQVFDRAPQIPAPVPTVEEPSEGGDTRH